MKIKHVSLAAIGVFAAAAAFSACSTPAGQGAATGAVGGALVAGPAGAAVGAIGGAIVGSAIAENDAARYGAAPTGGYPMAQPAGKPGFYRSPYSGGIYDLTGVPHKALVRDTQTNQLFRKP